MRQDLNGAPTVRPAQPAQDPSADGTVLGRLRRAALLAAPAIGVYVLLRILSLGVLVALAVQAKRRGVANFTYYDGSTNQWRGWETPVDLLLTFDGRWYTLLAAEGYGPHGLIDPNGVPYDYRVAFFPLYPWLIRLAAAVTGAPATAAALVVSALASIAAAWALFAIGNHLWGGRVGIMLAAAWALWPEGAVQQGAFTESLFVALAGWALYAVLTGRWVAAGVITAFAGLTRPTAVALVGTVVLAAVVAIVRRDGGWRPWAAVVLSPIGYVGHLLYAGSRLGSPATYFRLQRQWWDSYFDFGRTTVTELHKIMLGDPQSTHPVLTVAVVTVLLVVPLAVLAALRRTHWVLLVFAAAMAVGVLGSHAHFSMMPRHLMPAFPLLVAPAIALAATRTRIAVVVLVFLALLSGWYGGWVPLSSGQTV